MDVDSISDVSAVHASSIVLIQFCRVGEFPCIYRSLFGDPWRKWGWCPIRANRGSEQGNL
jgi:hypothetical protein